MDRRWPNDVRESSVQDWERRENPTDPSSLDCSRPSMVKTPHEFSRRRLDCYSTSLYDASADIRERRSNPISRSESPARNLSLQMAQKASDRCESPPTGLFLYRPESAQRERPPPPSSAHSQPARERALPARPAARPPLWPELAIYSRSCRELRRSVAPAGSPETAAVSRGGTGKRPGCAHGELVRVGRS